jgi:undecaprenyl-diphosphatase
MRRAELEALALGLLHGLAELVPVSSSGHVAAVPWLLDWEVAGWDGARRKELEVALHAGTAAALVLVLRPARVRPRLLAVSALPPALAGLVLERRIEERLGTPTTLAGGLLAGGLALVLADRSAAARDDGAAEVADGLALGAAQAAALIPGVSRSGATLAAARARGFDRASASRLSWEVALPVLAGATALKAWRVATSHGSSTAASHGSSAPASDGSTAPASDGSTAPASDGSTAPASDGSTAPASSRSSAAVTRARPLALGAGAALLSTLATARAVGLERRAPLWPWAAWRAALAGAILAVRHNRSR